MPSIRQKPGSKSGSFLDCQICNSLESISFSAVGCQIYFCCTPVSCSEVLKSQSFQALTDPNIALFTTSPPTPPYKVLREIYRKPRTNKLPPTPLGGFVCGAPGGARIEQQRAAEQQGGAESTRKGNRVLALRSWVCLNRTTPAKNRNVLRVPLRAKARRGKSSNPGRSKLFSRTTT